MKENNFDGWWEGETEYTCDCCKKKERYRFDSEDIDYAGHRADLKSKGWIFTKVNGNWKDFCSEACRNRYIRNNTI